MGDSLFLENPFERMSHQPQSNVLARNGTCREARRVSKGKPRPLPEAAPLLTPADSAKRKGLSLVGIRIKKGGYCREMEFIDKQGLHLMMTDLRTVRIK